jgi:hypothetical protein
MAPRALESLGRVESHTGRADKTLTAAEHTQGDNAAHDVVLNCDMEVRCITPC